MGGSVQALTRAPWLTLPAWGLAALCVHAFAGPRRNAPEPAPSGPGALREPSSGRFLREGLAFLAMAFGPLAFLISASLILWNR